MADPSEPLLRKIIQGCSRLFVWIGAAVFLLGGKFLYEIKHINFLTSEVSCILVGVLLMLIGAGISIADKSPKPKQLDD